MGFKGRLHAVLAHIVVPVISLAQGLLFRTVVDFSEIPQDMRPVGRLVLPHGGGGDLGSGVVAVVQQGDHLRVDVLRQHIGVRPGEISAADLVLDAQHQPGLLHGKRGGEAEILPHQGDQPRGGETGPFQHGAGQLTGGQLLQQGLGLAGLIQLLIRQDVVGGVFPVALLVRGLQQGRMLQQIGGQGVRGLVQILQIGEKAAPGRAVQGVDGVGEGGGAGDGQRIHPVDPPALTQLQQPQEGLVGIFVLLQQGGVKGQVVGGAAGHQHLAVSVGNVAPGGLHGLRPGDAADGAGVVIVVIVHLRVVQDPDVDRSHNEKQGCQNIQAQMMGFLMVHRQPPSQSSRWVRRNTAENSNTTGTTSRMETQTSRRKTWAPAAQAAFPPAHSTIQ